MKLVQPYVIVPVSVVASVVLSQVLEVWLLVSAYGLFFALLCFL